MFLKQYVIDFGYIFKGIWVTFCWQGSPRRGPETPTVTKSPPKGLPQSSQKQENETNRKTQDLDFRRPYQGLATLTPFWGALNDKKLPKKHATKTTTTRNRKKTQVEGMWSSQVGKVAPKGSPGRGGSSIGPYRVP